MLRQQKFLTDLLETLKATPAAVIDKINSLRKIITNPANMVLYGAANLAHLPENPEEVLKLLLPEKVTSTRKK